MKRNALTIIAALTVMFGVAAATPQAARADRPLVWVVYCVIDGVEGHFKTQNPSNIGDLVDACHNAGGQVAGVEPVFE